MRLNEIKTPKLDPAQKLEQEFDEWKANNFPNVKVDIEHSDSYEIHLNQISSSSNGAGEASACLKYLCALADQYKVTILGAIYGAFAGDVPVYGSVNLKLLAWYKRYGFEQMQEDEPGIWRFPKREKRINKTPAPSHDNLVERIKNFLSNHAKIAADYDPDYDEPEARFNGPDSALLHTAMEAIKHGQKPPRLGSTWGSGCYRGDQSAKQEHDALVALVNELAK